MVWNPSPKVADLRVLARKWKKYEVIVLALGHDGNLECVTYGTTEVLCDDAKKLGDVAFDAVMSKLK